MPINDPFKVTRPALSSGAIVDPFAAQAPAAAAARPQVTQPKPKGFVDSAVQGFKRSLPETKSLLAGAGAAAAGAVGADKLRDKALDYYRDVQKNEVEPLANQASFTGALKGENGFTEWAGDTVGNFAGQALQSIATGAAGAALGSAAPGAGTAGGAVAGVVARPLVKRLVGEKVAEMVAKKAATGAGRRALGGAAVGAAAATGLNIGQETGIAYTGRADDAEAAGDSLESSDALRAIAAGVPAGLLDTAAEALVGTRLLKGASKSPSMVRRVAAGAAKGAVTEGATEGAQAALERAGAGQELTGDEAYTDYIENVAAGMLGGSVAGGPAGIRRPQVASPSTSQPPEPAPGPLSAAARAGTANDAMPAADAPVVMQPRVPYPEAKPGSLSDGANALPAAPARNQVQNAGMFERIAAERARDAQRAADTPQVDIATDEILTHAGDDGAPPSITRWLDDAGNARAPTPEEVQGFVVELLDGMNIPQQGSVSAKALRETMRAQEPGLSAKEANLAIRAVLPGYMRELDARRSAGEVPVGQPSMNELPSDPGQFVQESQPVSNADEFGSTEVSTKTDAYRPEQAEIRVTPTPAESGLQRAPAPKGGDAQSAAVESPRAPDEARSGQPASNTATTTAPVAALQPAAAAPRSGQEARQPAASPQDAAEEGGRQATGDDFLRGQEGEMRAVLDSKRAGEWVPTADEHGRWTRQADGRWNDGQRTADSAEVARSYIAHEAPIEGTATRVGSQPALPAPGAQVAAAAAEAATSPTNDRREPSDGQKEAGNYKKGHVRVAGHDISIENPAGTSRRPEWPPLKNHYGYFKGTIGKDKDHVDVFLTDHAEDTSRPVFVVDQYDPKTGKFDEHKVIMGAANEAEARAAYQANYAKGWRGLGGIREFSQDAFKQWVRDPKATKRPASRPQSKPGNVAPSVAAPSAAVARPTAAKPTNPVNEIVGRIADGEHPTQAMRGLDDKTARAVGNAIGFRYAKTAKAGSIASNLGSKPQPDVRRAAERAFEVMASPEEKAAREASRPARSKAYNDRVARAERDTQLRQRERNGTIGRENGEPFKNLQAANKALKDLPAEGEFASGDFGVYKTEGGYVLRRWPTEGIGALDANYVDQATAQSKREEARAATASARGLVEDKFGNLVTAAEAARVDEAFDDEGEPRPGFDENGNRIASRGAAKPGGQSGAKRPEAVEASVEAPAPEPAKLDDFGEKLEGARKFLPPSLKEELGDDQIANEPLSKFWPADAHESIEDPTAAALAFAARAEVPAKPRRPGKVKLWVAQVKVLRTLPKHLADGADLAALEQRAREMGLRLDGFFSKVRLLAQLPRETWRRIDKAGEYPDARRSATAQELKEAGYERRLIDPEKTYLGLGLYPIGSDTRIVSDERAAIIVKPDPFSSVTIDGGTITFPGVSRIGPDQVRHIQTLLSGEQPKKSGLTSGDFEIRGPRGGKSAFINRKGDPERRRLKTFTGDDAVAQARAFLKEDVPALEAAWEQVKARDNVSKADARRDENRSRVGQSRRDGKDVTEQMFTDAFGFRGVQFGNWVGQGKGAKNRQGLLNETYDALLDLADLLGIPSRAISLNGSLGLSLGARGHGKSSAHFEPSNLVINLTKTRGAGTLAHEWFHALDNYFARARGGEVKASDAESYRRGNYITYKPEPAWVPREFSAIRGRAPMTSAQLRATLPKYPGYDASKTLEENASALGWQRDPKHKDGVRPEVERAFAELVAALNASPMAMRASRLDKSAEGYWHRIIERGARSFENYVISKLAQRGWTNDFLANVRDWKEWGALGKNKERYPYLLPEEEAPIVAAFDSLFDTLQTRETEGGNVALFSRAAEDIVPVVQAERAKDKVEDLWRTADEFYRSRLQGRVVSGPDGDVRFSKTGRSKALSTGRRDALRMGVARKLEEIVKVARIFESDAASRDNQAETFAYAAAPIEVDGKVYAVKLTYRKTPQMAERGFYTFVGYEIEDPGAMDRGRPEGLALRGSPGSGVSFAELMAAFNGRPQAFSRAGQGGGLGMDRALRLKQQLTAKWGEDAPRVVLVQSAQELQQAAGLSRDVLEDPDFYRSEGVYNGRPTVWLNIGAIKTEKRFAEVLAHEAMGHYGVERVIGKEEWRSISDAIDRHRRNGTGAADVRAAVQQVLGTQPAEVLADRTLFAKEVVAVMAERGSRNGLMQRVVAAIQRFLRRIMPSRGWSTAEIRDLINQAESLLHRGRTNAQARATAQAYAFSKRGQAGAFYSALAESVERAQGAPKKGTAEQWRGWLDGAQRRGEFKQAERDWLGVDDWLEKQGSPVTREALADFVRANQVQVQGVMLGAADQAPLPAGWTARFSHEHGFWVVEDEDGEVRGEGETRGEAVVDAQDPDASPDEREAGGATKFAAYQLPGGENYRELLLTLPDPLTQDEKEFLRLDGWRWAEGLNDEAERRWAELERSLGQEAVKRLRRRNSSDDYGFVSPHFSQRNILAHVRFNERPFVPDAPASVEDIESRIIKAVRNKEDARSVPDAIRAAIRDGAITVDEGHKYAAAKGKSVKGVTDRKVLFIEEIQSDWHQKGRKQGYVGGDTTRLNELKKEHEALAIRNVHTPLRGAELERLRELGPLIRGRGDVEPGVPDAPFKGTDEWAMLAFKRMVRYAAENGFDRIAWTTGQQQADRYDLSKQVDEIEVTNLEDAKSGEVSKHIKIDLPGSSIGIGVDSDGVVRNTGNSNREMLGKGLDDVVGKEIADRIMQRNEGRFVLSGDGLKVGGEGMRGFYDNILPKAVNRWAKKLGGKVGTATINATGVTFDYEGPTYSLTDVERLLAATKAGGPDNKVSPLTGKTLQFAVNRVANSQELRVIVKEMRSGASLTEAITKHGGDLSPSTISDLFGGVLVKRETGTPQHALDLTPAMREVALAGQPLFSSGGATEIPADTAFVAGLSEKERASPALAAFAEALYRDHGTDSPFFQHWFGDSKVVDKDGKPLKVYHGTDAEFAAFDPARLGKSTNHMTAALGIFTDARREKAKHYAELASANVPADEQIYELYLSIQNPYAMSKDEFMAIDSIDKARETRARLARAGHDGIQLYDLGQWIAFKPEQIKRTDNRGTFNAGDSRMLFSRAPSADIDLIQTAIREVNGEVDGGNTLIERLKQWLKDATPKQLKDRLRSTWLGALTTRHLTQLGADYFPTMGIYSDYLAEMGADRNQLQQEGENVAEAVRKWEGKNRREAAILYDLMHDATTLGVDPAEEYQPLQFRQGGKLIEVNRKNVQHHLKILREVMRGRAGDDKRAMIDEAKGLRAMLAAEPKRKARYPELVARWTQLSPEAQAHYRAMRDLYAKRHDQTEAALIQRINDLKMEGGEKRKAVLANMIRQQFEEQRLQGVYFPLQRFGRFFVAAEKGKESTFLMYESQPELQRAVKALRARGFKVTAQGLKSDGKAQDAPSGTFVAEVIDKLRGAGVSEKTQDEIYQMYLGALPELSMRKHKIHRKSVPGWDPDALRAFAFSMAHGAHQLARLRYAHKLSDTIEVLQGQQDARRKEEGGDTAKIVAGDAILDELRKRHEWISNPQDSKLTNLVSSFGFVYYLGLTPAAALVNLSQTPIISYPYLAARFGGIKAMNALLAASRDSVRTLGHVQRTLSDPDELRAHQVLQQMGALDKTQAHNLMGIAEGGAAGYSPAWAKAMEIIGWGFHKTEVVNREATGMAAFRLARAAGQSFDEAVKTAAETIHETHYDYTNANRARFMQSGTAKVLLMFRQYSLNTTWHLGRMVWNATKGESPEVRRTARRNLAGLLGMSALFSGVLGLPTMGVVMGVLNSIAASAGDDDEPWDAETEFRAFLTDMLGAGPTRVLLGGVANEVTGADIASRTSMSQLWFRDADRELDGRGAYYNLLEQAAGPMGGVLKNALVGKQLMDEGHLMRGVETVLPKALKDMLKSARYASEGVNNLRGDPLVADVSLRQALLQVGGFTPAEVANQYDRNRSLKNYEQHVLNRRGRLMDAFAMANRLGDASAREAVLKQIRAFNEKWPQIAITPSAIRRSLASRARYSQRAENGIMLNRKIAGRIREAVGVE